MAPLHATGQLLPTAGRSAAPCGASAAGCTLGRAAAVAWPSPAPWTQPKLKASRSSTRHATSKAIAAGEEGSISQAQVDDLSGVISKAMLVPGVPDWVKLGVVKNGISQVAGAINDGRLPPEVSAQVVGAMSGGLVSERLAGQVADAIAPHVDLPLLNEEQEREMIQNIVAGMIVQKEESNILAEAVKGTAKFAAVQGRGIMSAIVELRTPESRRALATRINAEVDMPVLNEEQEQQILNMAIDALGNAVINKVPAEALQAAVNAGDGAAVEEFLTAILVQELNIPFVGDDKKREIARNVVDTWFAQVDQDELKREEAEAQQRSQQEAAERAKVLGQAQRLGNQVQDVAMSGGSLFGGFVKDLMGSNAVSQAADQLKKLSQGGDDAGKAPEKKVGAKEKTPVAKAPSTLASLAAAGGSGRGGGRRGGGAGGGGRDGGRSPRRQPDDEGKNEGAPLQLLQSVGARALFVAALLAMVLSVALRSASRRATRPTRRKVDFKPVLPSRRSASLAGVVALAILAVYCVVALLRWLFASEPQEVAAEAAPITDAVRTGAEILSKAVPSVEVSSWTSAVVEEARDFKKAMGATLAAFVEKAARSLDVKMLAAMALAALMVLLAILLPHPHVQRRPAASHRAAVAATSRNLGDIGKAPSELSFTSKTSAGTSSLLSAMQPGARRAIVAADTMSVQLRGQLSAWLKSGGTDRELALAAEAAALFSVFLAREAVASESQRTRVALAVCPFDTLSLIFTQQRATGAGASRWQGKQPSVRKTAEWSRLKEWFDTSNGAGLLLRPTGDVYSVFAEPPVLVGSGDPWECLASGTAGVVVVVCERPLRPEESGRISMHSSQGQWASPEIAQQAPTPQAAAQKLSVPKVELPSAFAVPALTDRAASSAATAPQAPPPAARPAPTSMDVPSNLRLPDPKSNRLFSRRDSFGLRYAPPPRDDATTVAEEVPRDSDTSVARLLFEPTRRAGSKEAPAAARRSPGQDPESLQRRYGPPSRSSQDEARPAA